MFKRYLLYEFHKSIRIFASSLVFLVISAALIAAGTFFMISGPLGDLLPKRLKAAVYMPDTGGVDGMALRVVQAMDSVKSICDFQYVEGADNVVFGMGSGEYDVGIVLPAAFVRDVYYGERTKALLYVPSDPDIVTRSFAEILRSGMDMLDTSMGGVMSMWEISEVVPVRDGMDEADIGDRTAFAYSSQIFDRDRFYESVVISPFGSMDAVTYYTYAGIFSVLIIYGVCFAGAYGGESQALKDRLTMEGVGAHARIISGILSMWLCLLMVMAFIGLGMRMPPISYEVDEIMGFLTPFVPGSLAMAGYFYLILSITGHRRRGAVAIAICDVFLILLSGAFVPVAYL